METAVEWLQSQFENTDDTELVSMNIEVWFKIAKEMEKQQKEVDYQSGYLDCYTKLMSENLTRKI